MQELHEWSGCDEDDGCLTAACLTVEQCRARFATDITSTAGLTSHQLHHLISLSHPPPSAIISRTPSRTPLLPPPACLTQHTPPAIARTTHHLLANSVAHVCIDARLNRNDAAATPSHAQSRLQPQQSLTGAIHAQRRPHEVSRARSVGTAAAAKSQGRTMRLILGAAGSHTSCCCESTAKGPISDTKVEPC